MRIEDLYELFIVSEGITTDTRNLTKNGLFFALKGDNFNGNQFAFSALAEGCAYAIVDEPQATEDLRFILVEDVLRTLQKLANHHRKQFDIPLIGITGSNGKTTTKELAGAVLSQKYNVLITTGNLNNHLGVPLTLLRLNASHEIAIIEMGANKPGDIKELVDIAEPTHGIITNVGAAHIEGFGSLAGVVKTKGEMYDFLGTRNGNIFINDEDEILNDILPQKAKTFRYGGENGLVTGKVVSQNPFVEFEWNYKNYKSPVLQTNLVGRYNFTNFLLAISLGVYFEVENTAINAAIASYLPSNNRSQITKTAKNMLIVDCYNANATSMKAALESFLEMEGEGKLAILGDMLELGDISQAEHEKVVQFLEQNELKAILVGKAMAQVDTNFPQYENWEIALENENLADLKNALVLLKGSRGIKLEALIDHL